MFLPWPTESGDVSVRAAAKKTQNDPVYARRIYEPDALTGRTRLGAETDPGTLVRDRNNTLKPSRTRFFCFSISTYITRRILYTNGNYF